MAKDKTISILIIGKGGQGIFLVAEILSLSFMRAGYDVKMSASFGMAQRGGPVTCHVRAGRKVYSPLIPSGDADFLIAMESSVIAGYTGYLKKDGLALILGKNIAHDEIKKYVRDIKAANIFMLGVLSGYLPINKRHWIDAIVEKAPFRTKDINRIAFESGRKRQYETA